MKECDRCSGDREGSPTPWGIIEGITESLIYHKIPRTESRPFSSNRCPVRFTPVSDIEDANQSGDRVQRGYFHRLRIENRFEMLTTTMMSPLEECCQLLNVVFIK